MRELRDRIKALGAADVAPEELTRPVAPDAYDEAALSSLQLRVTLASSCVTRNSQLVTREL